MNKELKPCPFCGSTRVRVMYSDINKAHVVYCTNCKTSTNIAVREEDAIYLWNKRAEPERKHGEWLPHPHEREWDVCSVCGTGCKRREFEMQFGQERFTEYGYQYCPHCGADMRISHE